MQHETASNIFLSQQNQWSVINNALNNVVPSNYWQAGENVGSTVYTAKDNPCQIMKDLANRYGIPNLGEKEEAGKK